MKTWWARSITLPTIAEASSPIDYDFSEKTSLENHYANDTIISGCPADAHHKSRSRFLFNAILTCGLFALVMQTHWKDWLGSRHGRTDVLSSFLEGNPEPVLRPLPNCPPLNYIESAWLEFDDLSEFELLEILKPNRIPPTHIGGKVSVVEGPADQNAQIRALILYGSSDQHMVRNVAIQKLASTLIIDPTYMEEDVQRFPKLCLTLDVYLLIKPKSKLDNFKINVTNLSVDLRRGLTTIISNQTTISAASGNVACEEATTLISRETIIDVHSGSVTGVWALFDLLSVHTESGSISIDVLPKTASESKPLPANFEARAQSGSVAVRFPVAAKIPDRDYRVDVFSQSGSVSGSYIHGTRTSLVSGSGSLTADLLPFDGGANSTTLITESFSGRTTVKIMPPQLDPSKSLNNLQSRHQTHAGSLNLHYPNRWQGTIDGSVVSGSLTVSGEDVKIIKDDRVGPTRHIIAEKGNGESHIQFGSTSGSAVVIFG